MNMSHENISHKNKSYENMSYEYMSYENRFYEKMSYVQPHCYLTTSETQELDLVVTGSTSLFLKFPPAVNDMLVRIELLNCPGSCWLA